MKRIRNIEGLKENYLNKPINLFQRIFLFIPGEYFGLLSFFIIGTSISTGFLYQILDDPNYSIFTHWISHLSVGPKASKICFSIGLCIGSPLILIFHHFIVNQFFYKSENIKILLVLHGAAFIQSLGSFIAGLFPLNYHYLHGFAANMYFYGAFFYYMGLFLLFIKYRKQFRMGLIFSGCCVISTALFLISDLYTFFTAEPFPISTNYFLEWITFTSYLLFYFGAAIIYLKKERLKKEEICDQKREMEEPIIIIVNDVFIKSHSNLKS